MYVRGSKQLNPRVGGASRNVRVNSALPESITKPHRHVVVLDQIALE
jgi:hypothetical protein